MSRRLPTRPNPALAAVLCALSVGACQPDQTTERQADVDAADAFPVQIVVDTTDERGELRDIWRFFGADEPNYVYGPNGAKLVRELGSLAPTRVYFRAHNLLTTGDGTGSLKWGSTNAYTEDADGNPVYDWSVVDRIFDTLLERGVRPYVEIGFMPEALTTGPAPYRHTWTQDGSIDDLTTGWAYPPTDYDKWEELVYQWAKHSVERYGADEVEQWYWQTWNEPNIFYWQGTRDEYLKLHDYAAAGVLRALPTAKIGGADTAGDGGDYTRAFIEHQLAGRNYATGATGTKLDFVAFHAKGAPTEDEGFVRMGISAQLATIDAGFRLIADYPELEGMPVIIGESDPEGCAACKGGALAYRNGAMYAAYTAASFARKHDLADRHGVNLEGALTWAFTFEDQPYFAGFRSLASNGIDKPVLNVFRMFARMGGIRLAARSDHEVPLEAIIADSVRNEPDVAALASRNGNRISALVWHYHDDMVPGAEADVALRLENLPEGVNSATLRHFRVDDQHGNAYEAWLRMGSPEPPSAEQYAILESTGQLAELEPAREIALAGRAAIIGFRLPRRGVSLIELEWEQT